MKINFSNQEIFLKLYEHELLNSLQKYPEKYCFGLDKFDSVYEKMSKAIADGTFNKDSASIKAVCKQLKINHTYKAIREYFNRL